MVMPFLLKLTTEETMIKKLATITILSLSLVINAPSFALDFEKLFGAASTGLNALTVSDADVQSVASQVALQSDKENTIAPANSSYAKRFSEIIKGWQNTDGLNLNFKVYMIKEPNAFAMADGTVRVNSGLLDLMTDDEIRFVLGHEIGHVKLGHSKSQLRKALLTSTFKQSVSAVGGTAGQLASSQLGDLAEHLAKAQFSQKDEKASDIYGLKLLKRKKINPNAAVTAIEKLASLGSEGSSIMSSHPSSKKRADLLRQEIAKK